MSMALDPLMGNLLPHVYCKKIVLTRNSEDPAKTDVTLKLELYSVHGTSNAWLNNLQFNLDGSVGNIRDALCLQVAPITGLTSMDDIKLLKPSNGLGPNSVQLWNSTFNQKNIFVAKKYFGDAYLPRGTWSTPEGALPGQLGVFTAQPLETIPAWSQLGGSLFGTQLSFVGAQRQEVKNGKAYDIVPIEYKHTYAPSDTHLGFVFYTFLNVPLFAALIEGGASSVLPAEFYEQYMVEGTPNAEIVFKYNKIHTTKETFYESGGIPWDGPVHLHHGPAEATPDGYYGNGGFGSNKGWMAGEDHKPGVYQPKLSLIEEPNRKIDDFRYGLSPPPQVGIFEGVEQYTPSTPSLVGATPSFMSSFIMPFQEERRKYLTKPSSNNFGVFSKLYITRARNGQAQGCFFINFEKFLKNNSYLYPALFDLTGEDLFARVEGAGSEAISRYLNLTKPYKEKLLQRCELLELRLYRDRVEKFNIGTGNEQYLNDSSYEEPSVLIGTWPQPSNNIYASIKEVSLTVPNTYSLLTRYFTFSDIEISNRNSGLYQYRIELNFKDGTYEFLSDYLQEIVDINLQLRRYFDILKESRTSYAGYGENLFSSHKPNYIKPSLYYTGNAFTGEFFIRAYAKFHSPISAHLADASLSAHEQQSAALIELLSMTEEQMAEMPWNKAPEVIKKIQDIFGIFPGFEMNETIFSMAQPDGGSPEGISFLIKLLDMATTEIRTLIYSVKNLKSGTGGELTPNTAPALVNTMLGSFTSTITKQYIFEDPSSLFSPPTNKDTYIDYISTGFSFAPPSTLVGLRSINSGLYQARCQLDAAKYAPNALDSDTFNGNFEKQEHNKNIALLEFPDAAGAGGLLDKDWWGNTGYSYLTPSIIEVSSQSRPKADSHGNFSKNQTYTSYYSAFGGSIFGDASWMKNPQTILGDALDQKIQAQVYVDMFNYSSRNLDTDYINLSRPMSHAPSMKAESSKRFLSNHNITAHATAVHSTFFNKEPGAQSGFLPGQKPYYNGYIKEDFSDLGIPVGPALDQQLKNIKMVTFGDPSLGSGHVVGDPKYHLPNSYKMSGIFPRANSSTPLSLRSGLLGLVMTSEAANSFAFIQKNMTAKIEVFRGSSSLGADDEASWALLNSGYLEEGSGRLLCRIKYYDINKVKGLNMPILDEYFFITLANPIPLPFPGIELITKDTAKSELLDVLDAYVGNDKNKIVNMAGNLADDVKLVDWEAYQVVLGKAKKAMWDKVILEQGPLNPQGIPIRKAKTEKVIAILGDDFFEEQNFYKEQEELRAQQRQDENRLEQLHPEDRYK